MKAWRRLLERERADVLREAAPHRCEYLAAGHIRLCTKGAYLPPRVYPGVGAPRAGDLHVLPEYAGEKRLRFRLHGAAGVPLTLPAAVARPVLAQRQPVVFHTIAPFIVFILLPGGEYFNIAYPLRGIY